MAGQNYDYPTDTPVVTEDGKISAPWGQWVQRTHNNAKTLQQSGPTAERPTSNLWIGRQYFDTDLGAMYWIAAVVSGVATWITWSGGGGGGGDFSGPASSVNNNIVTFNGTTGKLGKDSGVGIASLATTTAMAAAIAASAATVTAKTKYTKGATWSGGGVAVTTPADDISVVCPVPGTITSVTVLTSGGSGSCVLGIWKDTYANYPPTIADSITAASPPTISAGIKYQDTTLTGWTTAVSAGDILLFKLTSTSTFTNIHIEVEITP